MARAELILALTALVASIAVAGLSIGREPGPRLHIDPAALQPDLPRAPPPTETMRETSCGTMLCTPDQTCSACGDGPLQCLPADSNCCGDRVCSAGQRCIVTAADTLCR